MADDVTEEEVPDSRDRLQWIVIGLVIMGLYLGALGGLGAFFIAAGREDDRRIEGLVQTNAELIATIEKNAEIADAERCVDDHQDVAQTRAAMGDMTGALVESSTDADPEAVAAFLANIERRIDVTLHVPDCDLTEAQATISRTGER